MANAFLLYYSLPRREKMDGSSAAATGAAPDLELPPHPAGWNLLQRAAFRFVFLYLALYMIVSAPLGVILGIESVEALASAWDEMQTAMAGIALDGILVERMVNGGLEMIVGARRDEGWGPVVMVGLGGIFVETLKDVRLMPARLSRERIMEECYQLKGAAMLRGARGRLAVDVEALADVVLRVAAAITARPEITEIDINPLTVLPARQGAIALDALIVARNSATEAGRTMIYTAWGKDGHANTLTGGEGPLQVQDEDNSELIWRIEADSWNEAMQKYYALQGWGLYKPMAQHPPKPS